MKSSKVMSRLQREHWRALKGFFNEAYREGFEAGLARAGGTRRQGRTVRDDATVEGLVRLVEAHFGLDRYTFEVRIVHPSGRRLPAGDHLRKYRVKDR
jgi:hypothetical protein